MNATLCRATLAALQAFLSWIPLGYIFESQLVEILLKHFPQPTYRNVALQCLTEVSEQTFWTLHLPIPNDADSLPHCTD